MYVIKRKRTKYAKSQYLVGMEPNGYESWSTQDWNAKTYETEMEASEAIKMITNKRSGEIFTVEIQCNM